MRGIMKRSNINKSPPKEEYEGIIRLSLTGIGLFIGFVIGVAVMGSPNDVPAKQIQGEEKIKSDTERQKSFVDNYDTCFKVKQRVGANEKNNFSSFHQP